jgi:hypothetical protein
MIKRLAVGLAIVGFATVLGGAASAAPAPADWSVTHSSAGTLADGCDMTHDCTAAWDW